VLDRLHPGDRFDARRILKDKRLAAVVTGTLDAPVLTATRERIDDWNGMVALFAARAKTGEPAVFPPVRGDVVATSAAREHSGQVLTAQAGQVLLFLLTMLLAGMVLPIWSRKRRTRSSRCWPPRSRWTHCSWASSLPCWRSVSWALRSGARAMA
jgi:hypothetical protein